MDNTATENIHAEQLGPKGIGGWLIPHVIGLIVGPILQAWHAAHLVFIFTGKTWERLTNPTFPTYNFFWKPALIFEFVAHVFFLCYLIALAILFFSRSRLSPKLIIILLVLYLLYGVVDLLLCEHIPFIVQHPLLIQKEEFAVLRDALACLIWIPYFCISKRVKNTFVE